MPTRKWTLTRREEADYRKLTERMRAAGAELDPSAFEVCELPWISLKVCSVRSYVRAMPTSCVFVLYVRIVGLAQKAILQEIELSSGVCPLNVYILDDPAVNNSASKNSASKLYRLLDGETFHRNEVLNHRFEGEEGLARGKVVEGLLLAQSFDSVPSNYTDRSFIPLCLTIANQFDEVHESKFGIQVQRIAARNRPRPERRCTLYDGPCGSPSGPALSVDAPSAVQQNRHSPEQRVDRDSNPRTRVGA